LSFVRRLARVRFAALTARLSRREYIQLRQRRPIYSISGLPRLFRITALPFRLAAHFQCSSFFLHEFPRQFLALDDDADFARVAADTYSIDQQVRRFAELLARDSFSSIASALTFYFSIFIILLNTSLYTATALYTLPVLTTHFTHTTHAKICRMVISEATRPIIIILGAVQLIPRHALAFSSWPIISSRANEIELAYRAEVYQKFSY
jgi:hypothetical protein